MTISVETFEQKLRGRKQELIERMEHVERLLDEPVDPDFGDGAIEKEDDEVLEAQGLQAQDELKSVEAALSRIENGHYGSCITCGNDISEERLLAIPFAVQCRYCAAAAENNG